MLLGDLLVSVNKMCFYWNSKFCSLYSNLGDSFNTGFYSVTSYVFINWNTHWRSHQVRVSRWAGRLFSWCCAVSNMQVTALYLVPIILVQLTLCFNKVLPLFCSTAQIHSLFYAKHSLSWHCLMFCYISSYQNHQNRICM